MPDATTARFLIVGTDDQTARFFTDDISDALNTHAETGSRVRFGGNQYRPERFDPVEIVDRTQQRDPKPSVFVTLVAPYPTLSFMRALENVLEMNGAEFDSISVWNAAAD